MKKGLDTCISEWIAFMVAAAGPAAVGPAETVFTAAAAQGLAESQANPARYKLLSDVTAEVCFMLRSLTVHDGECRLLCRALLILLCRALYP